MTSLGRSADAGPPDQVAGDAAGGRGISGHGRPDGRGAAPADAPPGPGTDGDPVADFAAQLRELRERDGRRPYRQLARDAHYSHTALSQAAAGRSLPSLDVTLAFVSACKGDVKEWKARWEEANRLVRPPDKPPRPSAPGRARTDSGWQAAAVRLRDRRWITAAGIAAAACTAVVLWTTNSATATRPPGQVGPPRLQVESSGLYVRYATVTNPGIQAGYAYVLNTGADKVHRSPQPVQPGQSWTYFFNRDLKDGAQICGSIGPGPATCVIVHA
jgi:Helix-turn-helix domain